jgi:hypothetical protein
MVIYLYFRLFVMRRWEMSDVSDIAMRDFIERD